MSRRGTSLVELIFAMGLGLTVLAIGYRAYVAVNRADDYESRREAMVVTVQSLMSRVKQDVRASRAVTGSSTQITLTGGRRVTYKTMPGKGVARSTGGGAALYQGVSAVFSPTGGGVGIALSAQSRVHRRLIHVEVSSYVSPRNR